MSLLWLFSGLFRDLFYSFTPPTPPVARNREPSTISLFTHQNAQGTHRLMAQAASVGSANGNGKRLHALVFGFPLQGHVNPAFHLTNKLASKGVIVTFVQTEAFHALIPQPHHHPFSHGFDVRYAQVSDGLPLDFDRSLNRVEFAESLRNKMPPHAEKLLLCLNRKGPPISCIIADTFFVWMPHLAKKFQLPLVSFWTQPATVFSIYYHMHLLHQNGHYPSRGHVEGQEIIDYIPGVTPSLRAADLPSLLQGLDVSTAVRSLIIESFEAVRGADWVICNTVYELESPAIDEMQSRIPFWSLGPLLPSECMKQEDEGLQNEHPNSIGIAGTASMWPESNCAQWLDSKPRHSVLYISFGSYVRVSKSQIQEMAMGLVESRRSFVWVLRPDIVASDAPDILPCGFLDEIAEQGLVVPWSSQLQVLSHPSVGGFLTHCGWNSILESIWMGVPMLAFPQSSDQYTNCKLIVEEWKVAIRLGGNSRSSDNSRALEGREVVARCVKELMGGREGREARRVVQSLRDVLHEAPMRGGSSHENLDYLLEELELKLNANQRGWDPN